MQDIIEWKKGIFGSRYTFIKAGIEIGYLQQKTWSYNAEANISGKVYEFVTKGFFKQKTTVIDKYLNQTIAEITYDSWQRRANVVIGERNFEISYTNLWHSKWKLNDFLGYVIDYQTFTTKGISTFDKYDEFLFLAGIYFHSFFTIMTSLFLASIAVLSSATSVLLHH